ncbi:hypothetical protein ACO2Q7_01180 [Rathayibacter sp. KR2-224]|uniref:hypothetical protein n=1 Tax=Rathayibacter sp. KR2-224 TaxID=3400913 RepID=UPI003C0DAE8D
MSERLHATVSAGVCIPGFAPRLAVALIGCSAALTLVPGPFGYVGVALAILGALFPGTLGAWGCALVIVLAQLARSPSVTDWHPYLMLAVAHLLHVLGALAIVVEPGGVLQLRALRRPLLRWAAIQLPAQCVLAAALLVAGSGAPHLPLPGIFAAIAALCVAALVVLVIRRR